MATAGPRCLIVERHEWETGGAQQQLQITLGNARTFFGLGTRNRPVTLRVFLDPSLTTPTFITEAEVSREYKNGTRRLNGFPAMGAVPASFVFFEETEDDWVYDVWWQLDKSIVAARYQGWEQGRNSQYGRGRLSVIVDAPLRPRIIATLG